MKKVLCGGCFNKIHPGHIYFLKQAKSLGDCLIVVLTNDENNNKPYAVPAKQRKELVLKTGLADEVVIGDASDYSKPVENYRPDIIALGHDQELEKEAKKAVAKYKIKVVRIKKYGKYSTKDL